MIDDHQLPCCLLLLAFAVMDGWSMGVLAREVDAM
jgi:hypothetical protein